MLDLVKQETERIDSRFLEPACGKGVFLAEVLRRKLAIVKSRYAKSPLEYERYAILALSSIYGIDILEDNVSDCRACLLEIFKTEYKSVCGNDCPAECENSAQFLLKKNVIWGDALTLKRVDKTDEAIVFSEWAMLNGKMLKRRDFSFAQILDCSTASSKKTDSQTKDLSFDQILDCPAGISPQVSDAGDEVWLPTPVREFPLTHYLKISYAEKL